MNFSSAIGEMFKLWWIVPILLAFGILKSPWFKGVFGEALVKFAARLRLPSDTYHSFHNLTLPTPDGTTQIDHVFVSRFGIFVVETKNMKGWIFGHDSQAEWTQTIFNHSFKFQNPLRQNYKHVRALQSALDLRLEAFHSVVVFVGSSTFKSPMPSNVKSGISYVSYIKSFHEPFLTDPEVERAVSAIQAGRMEPSRATHRQHVQRLRARGDTSAERKCPKCGNRMVLRTAKRGAGTDNRFWGCSTYPKCRMVQRIS